MAGKTNTKQICVYKTQRALLEFMDDTRYEKEPMASPHTLMSRIRLNAKDYSKGTGENAVDAFYNLSAEEFFQLNDAVIKAKTVTARELAICKRSIERLQKALKCAGDNSALKELEDLCSQFSESPNEIFKEAGEKISGILSRLKGTPDSDDVSGAALLEKATAEYDEAKSQKEIYSNIKILNYDRYVNPENAEERTVTMLKVTYNPQRNYPYVLTVANGWAVPLITKLKGVIIKEGSTRLTDKVVISLDERKMLSMLGTVDSFLKAMTAYALGPYFETVTNPILYSGAYGD